MVPIRKKQLHYRNCFRWWEQRESNPRPSACKADALNQLSYAPVFRFFFHIAASDFVSSVGHYREVTPSLLTRLPCTAKKQTSKLFLFPHCRVRLRIVGRSLPGGNSLSPHLSSLHCEKTNFKTVSFKELPFKRGFSERDCKGR